MILDEAMRVLETFYACAKRIPQENRSALVLCSQGATYTFDRFL
jgi:hypothetical protein